MELIEWKGLAALRAGRRQEAIPLFEEALAMAEQKAPLVTDRVRGQLNAARADEPGAATMKALIAGVHRLLGRTSAGCAGIVDRR